MASEKSSSKQEGFSSKVWRILRRRGIQYVVAAIVRRIRVRIGTSLITPLSYGYYRHFKARKTFVFQQKKYHYFYHKYNQTWRNERAVEIPIIWSIVQLFQGSILEVGNVLSHYFSINHDVVDKYEKSEGVINQDATEITLSEKYDLIVSISTLEHVGWDENPTDKKTVDDPEKILHTMDKLRSLLAESGRIVVTVPLAYNPHLDKLLRNGKLKFDKKFFMKRVSKDTWVEASWNEVENEEFNHRIPSANALLIGIIDG